MDRPKRAATKVTDFRKYHLSGDLDQEIKGLVDNRVQQFKMSTAEELKQQLELEKEETRKLQEDAEIMKIRNKLEEEKRKREEWSTAITKLKEARDQAEQEHSKRMEEMEGLSRLTLDKHSSLEWLKAQMDRMSLNPQKPSEEEMYRQQQEKIQKDAAIAELVLQQEKIMQQIAELRGNPTPTVNGLDGSLDSIIKPSEDKTPSQDHIMNQLKAALSGKKEEDPNKNLLRALITTQNKTAGEGGTSTLKPNIARSINPGSGNMAEWLAQLNRQDEGESELSRLLVAEEEGMGKPAKARSGILDKATTNIQQKQVWPQQNLGEDWADEDVEFKQLRFEHLVAGETRTIETCTDPAKILGRLRLLRRISYLKLRGYDWPLLRKMYAAILTSIETKEYS